LFRFVDGLTPFPRSIRAPGTRVPHRRRRVIAFIGSMYVLPRTELGSEMTQYLTTLFSSFPFFRSFVRSFVRLTPLLITTPTNQPPPTGRTPRRLPSLRPKSRTTKDVETRTKFPRSRNKSKKYGERLAKPRTLCKDLQRSASVNDRLLV